MAADLAEKRQKAKESFNAFMAMMQADGPSPAASTPSIAGSSAARASLPLPAAAEAATGEARGAKRALSPSEDRSRSAEEQWYEEENRSPSEEPSEEEGQPTPQGAKPLAEEANPLAAALAGLQAVKQEDTTSSQPSQSSPSHPSQASQATSRFEDAPWHAPQRWCLCEEGTAPPGYGEWWDWNDPAAIELEQTLAEQFAMKAAQRGPNPLHPDAPSRWKKIPWNREKGSWQFSAREQLPKEYAELDLWTALDEEAEVARRFQIPWNLRGPPTGPVPGKPKLWRGMQWRPNARKWMSRGGAANSSNWK